LARSWAKRTLWAIYGAAVWVALEMVSARIFGGFPWNLLGSSQYQMVPLIQIASVTGIYGVSFLVVWLSLSFLSTGLTLLRRPIVRSAWLGDIILPMLVVALLFNLGFKRLARDTPQPRLLSVTLIQPSIPQTLIWNAANDDERFRDLVRLSEQALSNRTDLLIWPEAAVPKLLRYDTNTFAAITDLARRHHIWMIVGSDDLEPRRNSSNPEGVDYFNSSFLIDPEGRLAARYLKRNLVIFGEYIPLADTVPFLKWFTPIQGGFASGDRPVPFELKDLGVKTSVMICYEDVFPHLARGNVEPDTDFLVNITNDGWFGEGAAQWQQTAGAVFRTVENNVPLIRCANNGLTCWVDACGRLRQILRDSRGSIYGPGYMTAEIPLPASGQHHARTYYNLHGDLFGWTCVGIAGALALGRFVRRRKRVGILASDF
jgi:apolipoprotein N-acyltransferase